MSKQKRIKSLIDISPFYFECEICNNKEALVGSSFFDEKEIYKHFEEPIQSNELDKIPFLQNNLEAQETIKSLSQNETAAIICSLEGQCNNSKCGFQPNLKLWLSLHVYQKDGDTLYIEVEDYKILDGSNIRVGCKPGFYRGGDIANGLQNLYLRWWYLNGEISVFCPFLSIDELQYFDDIGIYIQRTNSTITNPKYHKNPFKRIIARNNTSYYTEENGRSNYNKATLIEVIRKYLEKRSEDKIILEGHPGSGLFFAMKDILKSVQNVYRKEFQNAFATAGYFHGKLYGAILDDKAEMVVTSYNYTNQEILQLESLAFIETSKENFEHQIFKFENDPHMSIISVDISDTKFIC